MRTPASTVKASDGWRSRLSHTCNIRDAWGKGTNVLENRALIPGWMTRKVVDGPWIVTGSHGGPFESLFFPIDPDSEDAGLGAYRDPLHPGALNMFMMDFKKSELHALFRPQYPDGDDLDLLAQILLHYDRNA